MAIYDATIRGLEPLIQHSSAGMDPRSPISLRVAEITRKKGSDRTESDELLLRELECQRSLWLDHAGNPTIPPAAIRSMIERAARKYRQGPQVREGLVIRQTRFDYDRDKLGTTAEELGRTAQFTVPVKVGQSRILRTRAMFPEWGASFVVDADDELVDQEKLRTWLDIAGRRIGLGDWRPEKSGMYGVFELVALEQCEQ